MIKLRTSTWRIIGLIVLALRVVVPPFVFLSPFWVTIISIMLDSIDYSTVLNGRIVSHKYYHVLDKIFDNYYLIIIGIYSLTWNIPLLTVLLVWRLLGVVLVALTRKRYLFVFFPNLFEHMFTAYAFVKYVMPEWQTGFNENLVLIIAVITALTLWSEYLIHVSMKNTDSVLIRKGLFAKNYKS